MLDIFTCVLSFNPPNNLVRWLLLPPVFQDAKKSNHFSPPSLYFLYYLNFLYNMHFFFIKNNSDAIFILENFKKERNMPITFVHRV